MSSQSVSDLPHPGPLTEEQRKIIRSTAAVLAQHGSTITRHFYITMLDENPDLKNVFNSSKQMKGHQADALAAALYAYSVNIDDLTPLLPAVERICHKHASLRITPQQYAIVGKYLMRAITDILGTDIFAGELYTAWEVAYWQLAHLCINREAELYEAAGWVGWKEFTVSKRVQESRDITSFYLTPKDGKPLPRYRPGQYTAVQKYVKELGLWQARQYSISDAYTSDHFRISVKREAGLQATVPGSGQVDTTDVAHPGWISNLLHDTLHEGDDITVAAPFGDFFLDEKSTAPVVFLAAGVGLTPLLSMLNSIFSGQPSPPAGPISWIQASRSRAHHAFEAHVRSLAAVNPQQLSIAFFYSQPEDTVHETDQYVAGRMDLRSIKAELLHIQNSDTNYYICGPGQFMTDMTRELKKKGVQSARIHAEVFSGGGFPQ
ncbi:globin-like protein [Punctularia strigosozonata HHB-11173 SS5]|uniref:globin-like protein n=1 Tax=Punctularia strigosozonata (strain HHB-11173) TaxID=741275 RepID=UPI00044170C3|nr:globin-like protein [Punctularia strigosozonata HHB-11173 SS5]EIN10863.1 globin-like protein [Punctularia strigosozonata HHB-11173 SS5]